MSNNEVQSIKEYKRLAKDKLDPIVWSYFSSGAEEELTLQESENAFRRICFRPLLLRTERERDTSVRVLGQRIRAPVGIAPTAYHGLAHSDGEKGTARGMERFGTIMIVSTWASTKLEDVATAAPGALLWLQTFIFKNPQNTIDIIKRAENLGFKAVVITIDVPVGNSWKTSSCEKLMETHSMKVVNMDRTTDEILAAKASGDSTLFYYTADQVGCCPKWKDIAWVKTITKLPVIVKGVLTAEAAREAASLGVDGIIVSAHGGRQLDEVPAPIEALPEVVDAVRGKGIDVFVDGGIRTGSDILKALAFGAKMVFIGRPTLWALAVNGSDGVFDVLAILERDLSYKMALCGCNKLSDIDRSIVRYKSQLTCRL